MKTAIINFASGRYVVGQDRLHKSLLDVGFDGTFLSWTKEESIGSPVHKDNPYAFKIYAFEQALKAGYTKILWVDASIWAIKPLDPIWEALEKHGYVKQYAGHLCGTWSSDKQLVYFGVTRDEAMKLEMYGNGGFLALDFDVPIAAEFFKRWRQAMLDGQFKGPWNNDNNCVSSDPRCKGTRHDMLCGSVIANQLKMTAYPEHTLMVYVGEPYGEPPETAVMYAQGI
ncbi:hypothetical protein LCGC14_0463830 [marine sediment metagenome]|uniref:Uncharacterized protein n=1 Tax=marine sediment metagenome TaxID=412755 RepID=A0A0F9SEA7_9ZZZZ